MGIHILSAKWKLGLQEQGKRLLAGVYFCSQEINLAWKEGVSVSDLTLPVFNRSQKASEALNHCVSRSHHILRQNQGGLSLHFLQHINSQCPKWSLQCLALFLVFSRG